MTITELGAIGELVGGVAVIASLVFVGIQLRTTTRTLRSTTSYDALQSFNDVHDLFVSDPKIARAMMAVEDGVDLDFDETEIAQIRYVTRKVMMQIGAQQFLHGHGILDDALWERYLAWARAFIQTPHGVDWWAQDQHNAIYPREFVNLLNGAA